jgi:hypothetical protein
MSLCCVCLCRVFISTFQRTRKFRLGKTVTLFRRHIRPSPPAYQIPSPLSPSLASSPFRLGISHFKHPPLTLTCASTCTGEASRGRRGHDLVGSSQPHVPCVCAAPGPPLRQPRQLCAACALDSTDHPDTDLYSTYSTKSMSVSVLDTFDRIFRSAACAHRPSAPVTGHLRCAHVLYKRIETG